MQLCCGYSEMLEKVKISIISNKIALVTIPWCYRAHNFPAPSRPRRTIIKIDQIPLLKLPSTYCQKSNRYEHLVCQDPHLAAKWKSIIYIYHPSLYPRNYRHVIKIPSLFSLLLPYKIIVSRHNYLCILFLSNREKCFRIFDIINGWIEIDCRSLNSPLLHFFSNSQRSSMFRRLSLRSCCLSEGWHYTKC